MRKLLVATAVASLFAGSASVFAQAAAAPASPHTFTGNMTLATDYRFRGISQTFKLPTVQGGIDYSHSSGFYLGTWASNVSGNQYPNGASLEWDFYGGYKGAISGDLGFDVGLLYYWYPGVKFNNVAPFTGTTKPNNLEVYLGLTYQWLSVKYSHTLTDFFGTKNETFGGACQNAITGNPADCFGATPGGSKGSGYLDFTANYPLTEKLTLVGHVGHQSVRHYGKLSYTDWKIGLNYDLNGWTLGAAYVDTNATKGWYTAVNGVLPTADVKKVGEGTVVLSVGKTF